MAVKGNESAMTLFFDHKRIEIYRNGRWEQTYLLSSAVCDSGICLTISGPEVVLMHEVTVREVGGGELDLRTGAHYINGKPVQ